MKELAIAEANGKQLGMRKRGGVSHRPTAIITAHPDVNSSSA